MNNKIPLGNFAIQLLMYSNWTNVSFLILVTHTVVMFPFL